MKLKGQKKTRYTTDHRISEKRMQVKKKCLNDMAFVFCQSVFWVISVEPSQRFCRYTPRYTARRE